MKKPYPFGQASFFFFSFTLISIFCGLGTWQLYRKTEKDTLLTALAQSQYKPVQDIDAVITPSLFQPLSAKGHFLPDKTRFLQSKTYQGKSGVYVLDVFQTEKGKFLLVQRGWSPKEISLPPSGKLKITGIARKPSSPHFFQPLNSPPTYFWIDLQALSQDLNLSLLPYYVVAKSSLNSQILPTDPIPLPSNNHFQYAVTWYGLAFGLAVMLLWNSKYFRKKEKL